MKIQEHTGLEDEVIYFDSFGVEHIPKEILERIEHGWFSRK